MQLNKQQIYNILFFLEHGKFEMKKADVEVYNHLVNTLTAAFRDILEAEANPPAEETPAEETK